MAGRYQVKRQDGFTAIVESAHLWRVHLDGRNDRIVDTPGLRRLVDSSARVRLPQPPVISYGLPDELPIEPYLMGLLLGEGGMSGNGLHFTNVDEEIVRSVQHLLPAGHVIKSHIANERAVAGNWRIVGRGGKNGNVIIKELRTLGLFGTTARTKFIPACYRRASEDDRLALLQGLMDSDGHADTDGRVEFSSSSRRLAEDLLAVIRSLGGHAAMNVRTKVMYTSPAQLTPKPAGVAYRIQNINMPNHNPFRLTRKAARYRPRNGAWARRIKLVELMLPGCKADPGSSEQPFYDGFSWKQMQRT
jgi:LAGLIDADG DNA endonuclease family protein